MAQTPVDPASGGTATTSTAGPGAPTYVLRTFTSSSALGVTYDINSLDYLMVGGGGGGGRGLFTSGGFDGGGGGGGGGAVLNGTLSSIVSGAYPVVIGGGGIGGNITNPNQSGSPTTFSGVTAGGGGAGGDAATPTINGQSGTNGASGGGGGGNGLSSGTGAAGSAPGNGGGDGFIGTTNETTSGGGGGGAGGAGGNASAAATGAAGAGLLVNFHGSSGTYGTGGIGGTGNATGPGVPGAANTGTGGGGGARNTAIRSGGAGGSGLVMVYYAALPGVAISGAPAAILSTSPFTVTVTFSEDVTGFTSPSTDVTVTNGTATSITPLSATTYQVTIAPTGTGNVAISIPEAAAMGSANNQNAPSGTTIVQFVDTSASGTSITATPTSVAADGSTTSTITVQLRDGSGNPVSLSGVAIVLSSTLGTLASPSGTTNASGEYTTTITSTATGTATISMTVAGTASTNTATVDFTAGPIDTGSTGTSIIASPATVTADGVASSTITVQLRDVNGNPVLQSGVAIVLSSTLGTIAAPSGSTDAGGEYTTTITSTATGTATISMTVSSAPAANTATVAFTAGAIDLGPTGTSITASPASVIANGSSTSTITVQLRDVNGNPISQPGVAIVLSSTLGTIAAPSGSTDASGEYTTTITSPTTGTATISMTVGGTPAANTATVDFVAGPIDTSSTGTSIVAAPTTVPADGSTTSTITVQLRDVDGNPVLQSGVAIVLSSTIGTIAAPSGTTNASGEYTTTITSTATGMATISMTVNGSPAANTATVAFTAGAIDLGPTGTSIMASPASVIANGSATSTITVQLRDVNGNPISQPGVAVVLSPTLGTIAAPSGVTNASGEYTTTITSTATGMATISMTVGGSPAANTATVSFTAGPIDTSSTGTSITASPASVIADGSATSTITVQLRDVNGNPISQPGVAIVLSSTIGTIAAPSGSTNASGQYTTTITSTATGMATISMTVGGSPAANTATVAFIAGGIDVGPTGTSITASPSSATADGSATSTITVQLRDVNGNPILQSGVAIVLSSTIGTIAAPSGITNASGEYTTTITSTATGTATISMTVSGSPAANTAAVTFVAGSINVGPTGTSITASPATATADGVASSTIVVQLRDVNGNPVLQSGISVALTATIGTLAAPSGTTDANGQYTTTITSTQSGTSTISMNVNGFNAANTATVDFTSGPFNPGTGGTSIQATPNTVVANGSEASTIVVQLRDAYGNPVAQSGVAIVLSSTIGTLAAPSGTTDASGQYTTTITSTVTGSATISMTVDGSPAANTASIMFQDAVGASVVLSNAPASFAGVEAFTVTATFSKPVTNFDDPARDVIVTNGVVTAITGGPALYTLAILPTGKGNVSIKIPAGVANDLTSNTNLASNTLVVKNTVVEDTQRAISRFMFSRANNLASRQPVLTGLLMGDPCGAFNVNINGPNATGKFCASYGSAWTDFSGSWSLDGSYYLGTVGAHFYFTQDVIVGGMLQYDNAVNNENNARGTGWMYGPYFVARLPDQPLYFDGRILYGVTDNEVSPYGTYTDPFQTNRWLATFRTTGQVDFNILSLMPSLEYRHLEDTQQLYTDTLGNIIPGQTAVLTQLEAGVDFQLPVLVAKGLLEVTGGVSTIYSMTDGAQTDFEGARGKFELGANYTTEMGSRLNLRGFYDGVGSEFESYGGRMNYVSPF